MNLIQVCFPSIHLQTLLVCFLAMAIVSAIPIDESVVGEAYEPEAYNPQDPQEFFKLKKLKKLLLLG